MPSPSYETPDDHGTTRIDYFNLAKSLAREAAGLPSPTPALLPADDCYWSYHARIRRMTIGDRINLEAIYEGGE